jgi:hypothetical protein
MKLTSLFDRIPRKVTLLEKKRDQKTPFLGSKTQGHVVTLKYVKSYGITKPTPPTTTPKHVAPIVYIYIYYSI